MKSVTESPTAAGKVPEVVPEKPLEEASTVSSEEPKVEPKEYSKESEEMAIHQALSAAGRAESNEAESTRILEVAKQRETDTKAEQEEWQKVRDEAERKTVSDDPEALKSLEEKQRQRNEAAKLTERERKVKEDEAKVAANVEVVRVFNRTKLAAEIAVAQDVSLDSILKLTKEDTREAMEATAALLPKKGEGKKEDPLLVPSSKITGAQTDKSLEERYPTMHRK